MHVYDLTIYSSSYFSLLLLFFVLVHIPVAYSPSQRTSVTITHNAVTQCLTSQEEGWILAAKCSTSCSLWESQGLRLLHKRMKRPKVEVETVYYSEVLK
jgi:hypothetical protein